MFVLWSEARTCEDRIVADLADRFDLLDLVEVTWSLQHFGRSLTNFYGSALPSGSAKEQECGTGPFLVAVVRDRRPFPQPRRVGRRRFELVNSRVARARARYRKWTGGGYKVHASASVAEADRNLVLLFGRRGSSFLGGRHQPGDLIRRHDADPIGTHGWDDLDQLLLALDVTSKQRILDDSDGELHLEVDDLWWAERVLSGGPVEGPHAVLIAGHPRKIVLHPSALSTS